MNRSIGRVGIAHYANDAKTRKTFLQKQLRARRETAPACPGPNLIAHFCDVYFTQKTRPAHHFSALCPIIFPPSVFYILSNKTIPKKKFIKNLVTCFF